MKTIIRNFLFILRRFKAAVVLNVLGLSIAFLAFMLIMMQVRFDTEFDQSQPNANAIVRVTHAFDALLIGVTSRPAERTMREMSPHIQAGVAMSLWSNSAHYGYDRDGVRHHAEIPRHLATEGLTRVFDFAFIEGNADALSTPNSAIIPASLANRYFGTTAVIGKQFFSPQTGESQMTIQGVYNDFAANSTLSNVVYLRMSDNENYDAWGSKNYLCYFRLDDPANIETTRLNIKKNIPFMKMNGNMGGEEVWDKNGIDLLFTPLPELHYMNTIAYDLVPKASRQTTLIFITIALVVLVIAGINFTNFSTALSPMRVRSINTQKILGSSDRALRSSLLVEAVLLSVAAYLLSLFLLHLAGKLGVQALVDADITVGAQPLILISTAAIAVVVGLVAGLYPFYYVTSFPPALALKGNFGLSPQGRLLRHLLVGMQFVASFALLIGALFIYLQNHYMQTAPLGYAKEEVMVVDINQAVNESRERFVSDLKAHSSIADATFAGALLSSQDDYMGLAKKLGDKDIDFRCIPVSSSFARVMGIEVVEGRDFRPEDDLKFTGSYLFNQKAVEAHGIKPGDKVEGDEVVGIIPNIKFASLRTEVSPMAFLVWGKHEWWGNQPVNFQVAYIKVKAGSNLRDAREHVIQSLKGIDNTYPFEVRFYDQVLQATYEQEQKVGTLITLFSLVAVFISIVGVFGLVMFDSEYRRKEIGLRKVMGSTTGQILLMFNTGYLRILLICFVLAAPVAGYGVSVWLESFAYRIPIYGWVFAIALVLVSAVTLLTVTFQSWQVANDNPVDSLKTS